MTSDQVHNIIEDIANTSGHGKHTLLSMNPNVSKYLLAAYDPYTRYHITQVKPGTGIEQFTDYTWDILRKLSVREISGHDAQWLVDIHTEEMTFRSSALFRMIIKKDLRMGMGVKSINKVFPGLIPTHDVMLAKLFERDRVKCPCFGSPKIDGVRAKYNKGKFYSRNGHEYIGLDLLKIELQGITEELDGELTIPRKTFQESSGLIRDYSPTPDAVFNVFELPTVKAPFIERLMAMRDISLMGPHIMRVPHQKLNFKDDVYNYYNKCRDNGYEGAVIKPYDYEYKGSRSYSWMKMKPIKTVDLKVTNMFEGKGKYENQMGGVIVMFEDKLNKVGGGFSDEQRLNFWNHPSSIISKTIEVEYMEKTDDGNMRHSRFKCFRPDKEA